MAKKLYLLVIFFACFSCQTLKKAVQSPKVVLENVKITNMRMNGLDLEILLGVQNPNNIDFDVKNLTYSLDINDKKVTSGKLMETILVKAKDKTVVSLPLSLKYSDLLSSALMFIQQEKLPYRVKGSAEVGPFTIPFDDTGSLKSADL